MLYIVFNITFTMFYFFHSTFSELFSRTSGWLMLKQPRLEIYSSKNSHQWAIQNWSLTSFDFRYKLNECIYEFELPQMFPESRRDHSYIIWFDLNFILFNFYRRQESNQRVLQSWSFVSYFWHLHQFCQLSALWMTFKTFQLYQPASLQHDLHYRV